MAEIISLHIIPAYFLGYNGEHAVLACYLGQSKTKEPIIQKRMFDRILINHIKNPTKILIGVKTEFGSRTFTYVCGKHYHKPFTWLKQQYKQKRKQKH